MGLLVVTSPVDPLLLLLPLVSALTVARVSCGRPVWLTEGDTLYLRWQSDLGPLNRCAAVLPDGTEVALPDGGATRVTAADGNVAAAAYAAYAYVGDSYRSGQCGLRTDNVTASVGDWTLVATAAADGRRDRYTSRVTCIAKPSSWPNTTSTVRVPLGTALNVTCGPPSAFYCRMSGPSGEVSRHAGQCWAYVKSVGSHHLDAWTCWSVTAESAAEVRYTVRLQTYRDELAEQTIELVDPTELGQVHFGLISAGAVVEVGSDETPTEVRVYCNVRDATAADARGPRGPDDVRSVYCKLTLPREAHTLSLAYGRGTARYAYHGAAGADCGVSFAKPVRRSETGRWKCANAMPDGSVYGGFVVVDAAADDADDAASPSDDGTQPGRAVISPLAVTTGKPLMVSRGNSFRVECSVQSEIDYCWLRHPNGTTVPVTVPDSAADRKRKTRYRYAGEGLSFGQCHVTVDEAFASDTGTWLCALGLRDDRREVYGEVDVTVSDSVLAARQDELYAAEGSRVSLGCYTVEKQPIAYCRFLTPRLFGFAVDEKSSRPPPPPRYAYTGRGLTAGHCDLSIDRVDDSDYGNWTCAVKILDSSGSEEVSTTVVLRKPEGFTVIQIIGIVFCGTLISIMSLFFANHLITNPSAKTRKKIEKLELLEAAEKGGCRRTNTGRSRSSTRVVRTPLGKGKPLQHHGSVPRKI